MDDPPSFDPVAIVAAECILPGALDLATFYANNESGRCSIATAPADWWDAELLYDPDPTARNRTYTQLLALLPQWRIDASKFKLPPRQLALLDPVHALALELARRVVEIVELKDPLPHEDTAVILANIVGGGHTAMNVSLHMESRKWAHEAKLLLPDLAQEIDAYEAEVLERHPNHREEVSVNTDSSTIAGRICNYFNLRGPHYSLDGEGASSMVALHSACMGLHQGEFQAAIVGGVSRMSPELLVLHAKRLALSCRGCFPFDERADGFVPGEGGVFVVLMGLQDAQRQQRQVLGVIRGIGCSCNGRAVAPWAPSREAQRLAIDSAFAGLDFGPAEVDYVELHGASTRVGDEVEFAALSDVYRRSEDVPPLPLGSVKSMIGNIVDGAGLAGVLRAMFLFERQTIPPTVNIERPRTDLPFAQEGLVLQRSVHKLADPPPTQPRRVGVSSFGAGGVNYHLLVESASAQTPASVQTPAPAQTPASAQTPAPTQTPAPAEAPVSRGRRRAPGEPAAVIGMGAILPDAPDVPSLWRNLLQGHVTRHDLREHAPLFDLSYEPEAAWPIGTYLDRGAIAPEPTFDDYARFRILPKRQHRIAREQLLLLHALGELLDGLRNGLDTVDLARAGCIVGQIPDADERTGSVGAIHFAGWYRRLMDRLGDGVDPQRLLQARDALWQSPALGLGDLDEESLMLGTGLATASRIAQGLDLRGKSFAVRSACSTGLTVVGLALQELRQGTLDFVLCGATSFGVNMINQSILAAIQALSRQGQTRPYDQSADGFIIGSGAVMLAFKRLADAERDGDEILAVVREVAGASDGRGASLLAPNIAGRELVLRRTYARAGVEPSTVQYIEGHGAATAIGDQTEVESLATVMGEDGTRYLGSIKGNVGHLKAAAGLAAFVKTILSLRERTIVPHAGFERPDPHLRLQERGIVIPTRPLPWPSSNGHPRRAGINAFGLGGNNYHALVEEYVGGGPSTRLGPLGIDRRSPAERPEGKVCFLFTGQGSRYPGMLRNLADELPGFSELLDQAVIELGDEVPALEGWLREDGARSAGDAAEPPDAVSTQIMALVLGHALAGWLRTLDVRPDMLLGHSFGEVISLLAAGSLSYVDALRLAHWRGRFANETTAGQAHAMAVVFTDAEGARHLLNGTGGAFVANLNSPTETVISGLSDAIDAALARGRERGVEGQLLPVGRAFHTPLLEGAKGPFARALEQIDLRPPELTTYCTVTASPYRREASAATMRAALVSLYTAQVDFQRMIRDAYGRGARIFVEVGPRRALVGLTSRVLLKGDVTVIPLLQPRDGAGRHLLRAASRLWAYGLTDTVWGATTAPGSGSGASRPDAGGAQAGDDTSGLGISHRDTDGALINHDTAGKEPGEARCVAYEHAVHTVTPPLPACAWKDTRVLLLSDGSGLAPLVARLLAERGARTESIAVAETLVEATRQRLGRELSVRDLRAHLAAREPPDFIFFLPGFDAQPGGSLLPRHASRVEGSLAALREIFATIGEEWARRSAGGLIVVTRMDGRLGTTDSARADPLGGALLGFARAIAHELPCARIHAVDVSPFTAADRAAGAILDVAAANRPNLELGLFGEEWTSAALVPVYDSLAELGGEGTYPAELGGEGTYPAELGGEGTEPPWSQESVILATGGGRGITARILTAMMRRRPCRCILLGATRMVEVEDGLLGLSAAELREAKMQRFSELRREEPRLVPARFEERWRPLANSIEITRTLNALRHCGAAAEYVSLDLTRTWDTRAFAQQLRARGEHVDVLLHGAGIERSKLVWDARPEQWERTVATKVRGLHNLIELLGEQTSSVLLFGSIAGSFGGYGQTDYSGACEYLAHAGRRLAASLPNGRVTTIAWPAWEGIGLATREGSRAFFNALGLEYMGAAEGEAWALAALLDAGAPRELVVLPRSVPTQLLGSRRLQTGRPSRRWSFVDTVIESGQGSSVARWRFDPARHRDLLDHRVGGAVRLPAVHLIELLAEAVAAAAAAPGIVCIEDLDIALPVVLAEDRRRELFVQSTPTAIAGVYDARLYAYPLLPDGSWLPRRLDIASARVRIGATPPSAPRVRAGVAQLTPVDPAQLASQFALLEITYGPSFRGLVGYCPHPDFAYAARLQLQARHRPAGEPRSQFLCVALLDVALQSLAPLIAKVGVGLPVGFDRVEILVAPSLSPVHSGWAYGSLDGDGGATLTMTDDGGTVLARLIGLRLRSLAATALGPRSVKTAVTA
jgi:acyl transferase domain-containing protein